jgi:serine/threonine-protein kinase RsbW
MRVGTIPCVAIQLPAVPASAAIARHRTRSFAAGHGAPGELLGAIALAVTEAVSNVVRHAYPEPGGQGDVQVLVDIEDGDLEVVILDEGCGFTARPVRGLGVGLNMMRAVSDAFEVRDRPVGGVEVWMRFALAT